MSGKNEPEVVATESRMARLFGFSERKVEMVSFTHGMI